MRHSLRRICSKSGITLIETIAALVVAALFGAFIFSYFGTSFKESSTPIFRLKASGTLSSVMQKITAEYAKIPQWRPNTSFAANTIIIPSTAKRTGFMYKATTGGTTGNKEPLWPVLTGQTVSDGTVVWTRDAQMPSLSDLKALIGTEGNEYDNQFGKYKLIHNRFIKFDANNTEVNIDSSTTDPKYGRYLKVTIGFHSTDPQKTAETLSALYVLR